MSVVPREVFQAEAERPWTQSWAVWRRRFLSCQLAAGPDRRRARPETWLWTLGYKSHGKQHLIPWQEFNRCNTWISI